MKLLAALLALISLPVLVAVGCSGSSDDGGPATTSTSTSSSSAGSGGSGGGLIGPVCEPACQPPQFCSVAETCLDPGSCAGDPDCSAGTVCDPASAICVPGGDCGAEEFATTALPPNLLIALDRTGSMDSEVPNSGGKSRFQVASEAIATVLSDFAGTISFGLNVFSACTGGGCAPGIIVEPIGSSADAINQAIAQTTLCFSGENETVIGGTLQAMVGEPSLQVAGRDNAILLLTDGHDNCGGGGTEAAAALLAQAVPVTVYVVGFSGGVNAAELESIATAAGTAPYYQADDAAQLTAALQSIAGSVKTCSFTLSDTPTEDIYVFFNNDPAGVPQDAQNGWSYDPATNTLTFNGTACAAIESGTVEDIDVVFGCAAPTPD